MAHNSIQRPVLGQFADLGTLYDARTDTFVERSVLSDLPETAVSVTEDSRSRLQLLSSDSFRDKFDNLTINPELGASFLAGMLDVGGAAEYLNDKRRSVEVAQVSIQYAVATAEEKINFGNPELTSYIESENLISQTNKQIRQGLKNPKSPRKPESFSFPNCKGSRA